MKSAQTMSKAEAAQWKRAGVWHNAIANAWNMDQAPWAYSAPDGGSLSMWIATKVYKDTGDPKKMADAVEALAKEHKINPRVHRWHGQGSR